MSQTAPLLANPSGGAVVAGSATIGSAGATLSINQSTQKAIINWQQFSIAGGETTKFIVPNSGATLNRVVGGNLSAIYGSLQSNGALYLINPNGILVGPSGRINTTSFLGSTLDVTNQQFLAGGDLNLTGSSAAPIDNEGIIHATGGDVYLIANQVTNAGTLSAPHGTVGLAAGNDVLFKQAGSQHLFVSATPAGTKRAVGVTNSGTIRAAAAELKAAGGNAYALAINNTGAIAATGYKKVNGQVYLTSDGGSISNSGTISAHLANGNGGTIVMDGTASTSTTSGTVTNSGTLKASALVAGGTGGSVTLKNMSGATVHTGVILAQGGRGGGGGNVDISGETIELGGTVDTTSPEGTTGKLLIDPATLDVITGGSTTDITASMVDNGYVSSLLNSNNVTLNADDAITISSAINWTAATTLTLTTNTTGSTININAPIDGANGGLTLDTHAAGDLIQTSSAGAIDVATFILQNGYWTQDSGSLPAFSASNDFEIQGSSTFLRATGGNGTSSPYQITDIYGLQGIASPSNNLLADNFELVNNIDASVVNGWNTQQGFAPIGTFTGNSNGANVFNGTFNGQGYSISNLFEDLPSGEYAGLFGDTGNGSTIENLKLTNVNITGDYYAGGLAGVCNSVVQQVSVSGSVTGIVYVGGLAGISSNAISNCSTIANVSGDYDFGGLDGEEQFGTITDCYNAGAVLSGGGGLVGTGNNAVTNSFYDIDTSGQFASAGGTGESDGALHLASTYIAAGWNFATIWTTNGNTTLAELLVSGQNSGGSSGSGGNGSSGSSGNITSSSGNSENSNAPSTTTGGAADGQSNIVPPVLTPQTSQLAQQTNPSSTATGTGDQADNNGPAFNFTGTGISQSLGQGDGGLANSTGNSGQVVTGDTAQLNNGQLNNVANPQASGVLNEALGPIVYQNLTNALKSLSNWADVSGGEQSDTMSGGDGETILSGGEVAEMTGAGVKNIPLAQAPKLLRNAMQDNSLTSMGAGH